MKLLFNSSLPRSGSTLLQNLLAQNPNHHCTSTNDLLDMVMRIRDSWMSSSGFIAQGLKNVEPRIKSFLRQGIYGFYENELSQNKVVFDKSRGWLQWIELIEDILEQPIKIIVTVRDVRDILSSFEKIYRKSFLTDHPLPDPEKLKTLTVRGRAERLLNIEKTVGYMVASLQDVFDRNLQDRLVLVPYSELTQHPVATINRICLECGIPSFVCDPFKVEQIVKEDDSVYGMELHTIKSKVIADAGNSWLGILPDDLADEIDKHFSFVRKLSQKKYIT